MRFLSKKEWENPPYSKEGNLSYLIKLFYSRDTNYKIK